MNVRRLLSLAVASSVLAISSIASADALPPDAEGCINKNTGDTCMTAEGATGTCSPEQEPGSPTCGLYAMEAGTDAQACSMVVQICISGGSDAGQMTGGTDGGTKATGDGGTSTTTPTASSKSGGCSTTGMSASDVARAGAPFLLAALVPLVLRKRKRKNDRA